VIDGISVLAIITARGGSKGLPRKNVRPLCGKPLIAWTIDAARQAGLVDRTILSTDDEEIAAVAREFSCEVPFMRSKQLAADDTPSLDVVLDALDRAPGFELIVLLQPTSPLRTAEDIDAAIRLCVESNAPGCVSVCEADKSPYWMYTLDQAARMHPLMQERPVATRRQDLPTVHVLNGAVYVSRVDMLRAHRAFVVAGTVAYRMPKNRSVDIDTELDLMRTEWLLQDSQHE
jgi:CMP-N,N'-diacetyllegionaminic acid synthase